MNKFLRVNVTEEDRNIIEKVCTAREETISSFVRKTIRKELAEMNYYSDDVKKALGVTSPRGGD